MNSLFMCPHCQIPLVVHELSDSESARHNQTSSPSPTTVPSKMLDYDDETGISVSELFTMADNRSNLLNAKEKNFLKSYKITYKNKNGVSPKQLNVLRAMATGGRVKK